ncbi:hypothetical protein OG302_01135 [Streptomyces sp. NBC_01283]|uniref:hypothetical protein n=1 Tax=Streptomyces sp. NBC_01283 TaxID=2903812 RepID=UPI00352BE1DE|nr:hypothetical protein OG302_01135 [Streptomyces sp. NBC_01283]
MGVAFVPMRPAPRGGTLGLAAGVVALALSAALLAWGGALLYLFEMDTAVRLSGDRLVATYYGACNTVSGIAISPGNLAVGALLDTAMRWLPWAVRAVTGVVRAGLMLQRSLRRSRQPLSVAMASADLGVG